MIHETRRSEKIGITLFTLAVFIFLALSIGCSSKRSAPEKSILKKAFSAIKKNDWEAYSKITITRADYEIRKQKMSKFKAKQSYVGGVLKSEEREKQKAEFIAAVAGGEGLIDFKNAKFVGLGTLLGSGISEGLLNSEYSYRIYSLRIKTGGQVIDTVDLSPKFVLVLWGKEFRILELLFDKSRGTLRDKNTAPTD